MSSYVSQFRNEFPVDFDASQIGIRSQKFVIIMQQNWRIVDGGESKRWNVSLKHKNSMN